MHQEKEKLPPSGQGKKITHGNLADKSTRRKQTREKLANASSTKAAAPVYAFLPSALLLEKDL